MIRTQKEKGGEVRREKNVETAYDIRCAIFDRSIRSKTRASGTRIPGYLRNPTKYTDRIRSDLFSLPLEILFGRARWLPGENKHFSTLFRPLKRVERARARLTVVRASTRASNSWKRTGRIHLPTIISYITHLFSPSAKLPFPRDIDRSLNPSPPFSYPIHSLFCQNCRFYIDDLRLGKNPPRNPCDLLKRERERGGDIYIYRFVQIFSKKIE